MSRSKPHRRLSADDRDRSSQQRDPAPLGSASRWWSIQLWEIGDNGDGHLLTPAGEYPQGSVPPEWRAAWWFAVATAAHMMAMACEHEAEELEAQSR